MAIEKYTKKGARKSFKGKQRTQVGGIVLPWVTTKSKQSTKPTILTNPPRNNPPSSTNLKKPSLSSSDLTTLNTIKESLREMINETDQVIENRTNQDTVEYYADKIKKDFNELTKQKYKSATKDHYKIKILLGNISKQQVEESSKITANVDLKTAVSSKNIMIADLYLLKTNRDAFFEKYKTLLGQLTEEQKDMLAYLYEFQALSEKLQKMTDIAKRKDERKPQEVEKNIKDIDAFIKSKEKKANNTFGFGNEIKTITIKGDTPVKVDAHMSWSDDKIIEKYNELQKEIQANSILNTNRNSVSQDSIEKIKNLTQNFKNILINPYYYSNDKLLLERMNSILNFNSNSNNNNNRTSLQQILNQYQNNPNLPISTEDSNLLKQYLDKYRHIKFEPINNSLNGEFNSSNV